MVHSNAEAMIRVVVERLNDFMYIKILQRRSVFYQRTPLDPSLKLMASQIFM